ncbi:MAG TPA: hypothetical protein PK683_20485 [Leptospiraceae bacterium]|nr:hypothetical protein [Leptospiraceae bacterium]HNH10885.1 hypothetical protein [Leptospiraceae bacterium]
MRKTLFRIIIMLLMMFQSVQCSWKNSGNLFDPESIVGPFLGLDPFKVTPSKSKITVSGIASSIAEGIGPENSEEKKSRENISAGVRIWY